MKRLLVAIFCLLPTLAFAQSQRNPCYINSNGGCTPVSTANPMPVTSGGSGNTDVNLTKILGAVPSATNPLWISPATGATFPISGSITPSSPTNFTTAQVSIATSNTVAVVARTGRRSVTITNITGTQPIYCSGTTATTANGQYIPAVVGANFTVATTAAINCIASTGAQTISVAETY